MVVENEQEFSLRPENKLTVGAYSVVIGENNTCGHSYCVVIGNGLTTTEDYQLIVGNVKVSLSRQMTQAEQQEIYGVLRDIATMMQVRPAYAPVDNFQEN